MRRGVPRLLETLREFRVTATFFLSFGPDNSGKAIWNVFRQRGFLKKMVRTGAPGLYGWRTMLSGTLLPARPIARDCPDLVKRIEDEGHEAEVHAWDHRLWQDHLAGMDERSIAEQFRRSFELYERALGHRPRAVAAPAWFATAASLAVQDSLGLEYCSDMRGGEACYPELGGRRFRTLQVPTTQPCLEELLNLGVREPSQWLERILPSSAPRATRGGVDAPPAAPMVIPLHAEVEGGVHAPFLRELLARAQREQVSFVHLRRVAELVKPDSRPAAVELREIEGRSGAVLCRKRDRAAA